MVKVIREDCPAKFANHDADPRTDFKGDGVGGDLHDGEGDGITHCGLC